MEYWTVSELALGIVITCRGHDKERTVSAAVRAPSRARSVRSFAPC